MNTLFMEAALLLKAEHLVASKTPREDIKLLAYPGQAPDRKMYRPGYEVYFEMMPVLNELDPEINDKVQLSVDVVEALGAQLKSEDWWKQYEEQGIFRRTILALQSPTKGLMLAHDENTEYPIKAGPQIMLGHIGKGVATPVHGHASGLLHEYLVSGKIRVDSYRLVDEKKLTVRSIGSTIITGGTYSQKYTPPDPKAKGILERQTRIHRITALEHSEALLYFPTYSQDGTNSTYNAQYFEETYDLKGRVTRINGFQGLYSKKGDVLLVRSVAAKDYGYHYVVITGGPVMLEQGMRPEGTLIVAPFANILDTYEGVDQVILKLDDEARKAFHEFHGITTDKTGNIIFPNA